MSSQKTSRENSSLVNKIAGLLHKYILESGIHELPSIQTLKSMFPAGETTIRKAVKKLAGRGIVENVQGRKTRVIQNDTDHDKAKLANLPPLSENARRLYNSLRSDIIDGTRKTGSHLPKIDYLTAKFHISRSSCVLAFRHLERECLVHKRGTAWIVGPEKSPIGRHLEAPFVTSQNSSVILVMCASSRAWKSITTGHREIAFAFALSDELDKYHIKMIACGSNPRQNNPAFPSGIESLRACIAALGERYLGTLLVGNPFPEILSFHVHRWLSLFAQTGKPLVWCNLRGEESDFAQRKKSMPSRLKFFQISLNPEAELRVVLKALADLGHVRIGAPYVPRLPGNWSVRRATRLSQLAREMYPDMTVIPADLRESIWAPGNKRDIEKMATNFPEWTEHGVLIEDMKQRILHMHAGSGAPSSAHEEASLSMVMQAGSSLVNLLRDRNVTALIVPNDIYACRIYALFQMLGLSVPQDISIVSFDNSTFMRSYPIATIDRGYTHIAYCAVHLCIGDIPVQTDAFRRLYAKCRLIDRGSMDKPRHRRLQF